MRATPNQEIPAVYVKKLQNGGQNSQKAFACLIPPSLGLIFAGGVGGLAISDHLANRLVSRFGSNNTELLRGVIGPMSSLDDCLNTVFDEVVRLRGICRNRCLATVPKGKASTCCISF